MDEETKNKLINLSIKKFNFARAEIKIYFGKNLNFLAWDHNNKLKCKIFILDKINWTWENVQYKIIKFMLEDDCPICFEEIDEIYGVSSFHCICGKRICSKCNTKIQEEAFENKIKFLCPFCRIEHVNFMDSCFLCKQISF
jgi:hypothetical protein